MNKLKQRFSRIPATISAMSEWSETTVSRFSAAMRARRKELDLSVQDVANRTKELGHPISRSTLSGLENNRNKDRLTLPDALVIAEVLRVPMLYLLYPEQPDKEVEYVPGHSARSLDVIDFLRGKRAPYDDGDIVEVEPGIFNFRGRGEELESGYSFPLAVSQFNAFRDTISWPDLDEWRESAKHGDKNAELELSRRETLIDLLKSQAALVRALGGVVDDEMMPHE